MRENPEYALHYLQVLEQNGTWTIREGKNPARPDVLNPEAMRAFVRSTHERYAEKLGEFFGTLIKGIFSDEPSFLYVWHGETNRYTYSRIACYPGMREEYAERTGRQLDADLVYCLKKSLRSLLAAGRPGASGLAVSESIHAADPRLVHRA